MTFKALTAVVIAGAMMALSVRFAMEGAWKQGDGRLADEAGQVQEATKALDGLGT